MFSKPHYHLSLFAAFVFMMNALSPAWVTLLGNKDALGNGIAPICTAYGIQYISLEDGEPVDGESPITMMEHCPLCILNMTAFAAVTSEGLALMQLSPSEAFYVFEPQFFSPTMLRGYISRAPPVFS